jgi:hypothetical protein
MLRGVCLRDKVLWGTLLEGLPQFLWRQMVIGSAHCSAPSETAGFEALLRKGKLGRWRNRWRKRMSETSAVPDPEKVARYCVKCGYDLRATTEPRCPECGFAISRDATTYRIPWVNRRELGRAKAWRSTFFLAIFSPRKIAGEMAHPVDWRDASGFRWCNIWLTALLVCCACGGLYHWMNVEAFSVEFAPWPNHGSETDAVTRLFIPSHLSLAGIQLVFTVTVYAFVVSAVVSWWLRLWFWTSSRVGWDRASAISCYWSAWFPVLAVLFSADLAWCAFVRFPYDWAGFPWIAWVGFTLTMVQSLVVLIAGGTLLRLLKETTGCGWVMLTTSTVVVPAGIAVILWISAILVTNILGLLAIVMVSLR